MRGSDASTTSSVARWVTQLRFSEEERRRRRLCLKKEKQIAAMYVNARLIQWQRHRVVSAVCR
jgi:hypothetical protein